MPKPGFSSADFAVSPREWWACLVFRPDGGTSHSSRIARSCRSLLPGFAVTSLVRAKTNSLVWMRKEGKRLLLRRAVFSTACERRYTGEHGWVVVTKLANDSLFEMWVRPDVQREVEAAGARKVRILGSRLRTREGVLQAGKLPPAEERQPRIPSRNDRLRGTARRNAALGKHPTQSISLSVEL
jgi:hypothetical protein